MSEAKTLIKLNIGCGGSVMPGYVHLDKYLHPHVDILYDLDSGEKMCWFKQPDGAPHGLPLTVVPENYFDRMLMSHVFEHIRNPLDMMEELWRVAKPGCRLAIITPYGSSDNAWEDPTHVRAVFMETYQYFSQAWYAKNDYGYRADWHFQQRMFYLNKKFFPETATQEQVGYILQHMRNVVVEFHAELVAVKPIRKHPFEFETPHTSFKMV